MATRLTDLEEMTLRAKHLTSMLDTLVSILFEDERRVVCYGYAEVEEKATELVAKAKRADDPLTGYIAGVGEDGRPIYARLSELKLKTDATRPSAEGVDWLSQEGQLEENAETSSGKTTTENEVIEDLKKRIERAEAETKTMSSQYREHRDILANLRRTAAKDGQVFLNVCNILFEDEERAATHKCNGIEQQARELVRDCHRLENQLNCRARDYKEAKAVGAALRHAAKASEQRADSAEAELRCLKDRHEAVAERAAVRIIDDNYDRYGKPKAPEKGIIRSAGIAITSLIILSELNRINRKLGDICDSCRGLVGAFGECPCTPNLEITSSGEATKTKETAKESLTVKVELTPELESRLSSLEEKLAVAFPDEEGD